VEWICEHANESSGSIKGGEIFDQLEDLFHCTVSKLLIRKRYYVLFLIPVFIVQVTKLVQFT
jgi:hypothetical protein